MNERDLYALALAILFGLLLAPAVSGDYGRIFRKLYEKFKKGGRER